MCGGETRHFNDPGQRCQQTTKRIDDDFDFIDVDTRKTRCRFVAAQRVDVTPQTRVMQHVPGREEDNPHDPDWRRYAQRTTNTKPAKQIGVLSKAGIHWATVGINHGHAAQ
ncbi:Uncharacterised protein [Shigella sonnei]|nr:Uncharacterised protein [Shigella sonnei]